MFVSFSSAPGVYLVSVWALGFGLDAYRCDVFVLYPLFLQHSFLEASILRDLGLVWSGLVYLQWNGCKVTLVSLGFLVDYRDAGVWDMLDKSIYH
jgi:hypothetical protein